MRYADDNGFCDVEEGLRYIDHVEEYCEDKTVGDPSTLQMQIEHLEGFRRAAEQTVTTCRQHVRMLEKKRGQLNGQEAFAKFEQAIAKVEQIGYAATVLSEELSRTINSTRCRQRSWEAQASLSSHTQRSQAWC